jgi:hypothetical protein
VRFEIADLGHARRENRFWFRSTKSIDEDDNPFGNGKNALAGLFRKREIAGRRLLHKPYL